MSTQFLEFGKNANSVELGTAIKLSSFDFNLFGDNWSLRFSVRWLRLAHFLKKEIVMKKLVAILLVMLSIVGLSSCLGGVEFELNFVVDGEIYDTVTTNGKEIVKIPNNPAKEDYTFDGWYWDKGEWNKPFTANSLLDAPLSSNMSVYAKWKANEQEHVHTPSDWIEDVAATCKAAGSKHKECTECEAVLETIEIEKLTTHTPADAVKEDFVDSTCEAAGSYNSVVYCSVCEAKISSEAKTVEKKKHIFDQTNTDSRYLKAEATCTASARYYYSCSCGERGTADFTYGEPDGHNFVDCQCNKCGVYVTSKGLKLVLNSDNSSYTLKGIGSFSGGRLVIDTYEGLPITIISNSAFENCTVNITEIIIGNSVQSIGDYAFEDCSNVTNLVIGNNVTSIGEYAFSRCTRLRNLIIPSSVKSIGNFCFSYCMAIESVTIPSTVETLGAGAFSTCEGLVSVDIESGITSIEGSTFSYCINLERVTIPATVESIGNNAFYGCKAMTSVDISNASIGDSAFGGCQVLKTVTLGDGVTSIGSYAFSGCVMLETIFIPINVTTINSLAFNGCKSLVVYCETSSWPSGWENRWNNSVYSVVWGCKKQI